MEPETIAPPLPILGSLGLKESVKEKERKNGAGLVQTYSASRLTTEELFKEQYSLWSNT
jgi:hypothetical protein